MTSPFEKYLAKIQTKYRSGKAVEHTYRSSLESLLESLASGVKAYNDPKHIECGAPDFIVERSGVPLGYVETKNISRNLDMLDKVEKSAQLKRYRQSLNNLILTDYLEFRWYVNGERRLTSRLAKVSKSGNLSLMPEGIVAVQQLFNEFYRAEVPTVCNPKDLAERMAQLAKFVYSLTLNALQAEEDTSNGALHRQYHTFQRYLLPALKPEGFADIYAQTMAYGLFAAKVSAPKEATFSRAAAYQYLSANRFLRKLFLDVGEELEGTVIAPFLDDLAALLARADMTIILKDFGKRTRTEDPVVHFYETFLAAYNPRLKKSRGVYYTPEPAVKYIVKSVDWLLRNRFDRPLGLADKDVYLLDPSTGTSTFLYFVIRVIYDTLMARQQGGKWQDYVHEKLLPRLFGFELLMAPYVIAHLKLGLLLRDLGYQWDKEDRLRIFLTNALDEGVRPFETVKDLGWYIWREASEAAEVKRNTPIMVVLGNPPYSGNSANNGEWITQLVRDYYFVDGLPLGEPNSRFLQDDYVKFIRFAQWRIQQTGYGVLAFITNHGYLDNSTFRGLRQNLLTTFDEIYVLDLHGNSKKEGRAPDGGKNENIFDIKQGVAILLALKMPKGILRPAEPELARIHHAEIYGDREAKYAFLECNTVKSTTWRELQPAAPHYLFLPMNVEALDEYERGWKITEIMPVHSNGIVTARDKLAIHWSAKEAFATALNFVSLTPEEARRRYDLGEDKRDWKVRLAQDDIRSHKVKRNLVVPILYRPFDIRFSFYTGRTRGFICMPRREVMQNMLAGANLGLITSRLTKGENFAHTQVTQNITEAIVMSPKTSNNGFLFPLYLYTTPENTAGTFFAQAETTRTPNLSLEFLKALCEKLDLTFVSEGAGDLKKTFGPEDIFNYAYAVFHSPTYRKRYAEFLKIDFPRLPLTSDKRMFAQLAAKGAELVSHHLLTSPVLDDYAIAYPISGSNVVEKVRYEKTKVWISDTQYFGDVPENVWTFKVGGYQVCDKWLKDRKGRKLNTDDINYYQRIVVALKETIRLMAEIDAAIPSWPIE